MRTYPWLPCFLPLVLSACGSDLPSEVSPPDTTASLTNGTGPDIASSDGTALAGSSVGGSGAQGNTAWGGGASTAAGGNDPSSPAGESASDGVGAGGEQGTGARPGSGGQAGSVGGSTVAGNSESSGGTAGLAGEPTHSVTPGTLLLSEYIEGPRSDKAVELSNRGSEPVLLEQCELDIYFNGKTKPSTIRLTGELAPNSSTVVCHTSAGSEIQAACQQPTWLASFNGDDAIVLTCDGLVHDSLGQVGVRPDTGWGTDDYGTADQTLRRACGAAARTDPSADFDVTLDWELVPRLDGGEQDYSGLGEPTCAPRLGAGGAGGAEPEAG